MSELLVNPENALKHLRASLNMEMQRAAEPIIRKALEDVEKAMRERMAALLIAHIERSFSVRRNGTDLEITVHQAMGGK